MRRNTELLGICTTCIRSHSAAALPVTAQILFSGFFIPEANMPDWLAWLTYVFPLNYAVKLVLVYEFDGNDCFFCDTLLESVNAKAEDTWWYWLILAAQFTFFRLLALLILHRKAQRFS